MDTIYVGGIISFAMEAYEKGIIFRREEIIWKRN
jgi:aldehyde:ferredoxin oxidoreductase